MNAINPNPQTPDAGATPSPVPAPAPGATPQVTPDTPPPGGTPSDPPAGSLISAAETPPGPDPLAPLENFEGMIPEGFTVTPEQTTELLELVNKAASRVELVKSLIDYHAKTVNQMTEGLASAWEQTQEQWRDAIRTSKEYGGENLARNMATAKEVALLLGGKEFLDLLDATGAGNNIHMLRALMKARELIPAEAKPITAAPAVAPKSLAEKMFPKT